MIWYVRDDGMARRGSGVEVNRCNKVGNWLVDGGKTLSS